MRRFIFCLSCTVFIACLSIVGLPMLGALFGIVPIEIGAQVFTQVIVINGGFYALAMFASFVGINAACE